MKTQLKLPQFKNEDEERDYRLKERANAINVPYQSLIKEYIEKGVNSSL